VAPLTRISGPPFRSELGWLQGTEQVSSGWAGVPHFFFHLRNGRSFEDAEGVELADLQAAKVAAVRFAGQILFDMPDKLLASEHWEIEVTDGEQRVFLLTIGTVAAANV